MKELTPRQKDIFDFICQSIEFDGYPPTIKEMCEHFNIRSTNGINDHLIAIEKKGYIKRLADKSRAIEVLVGSPRQDIITPNFQSVNIPLLGNIAAGVPLLAEENREDTLTVNKDLFTTPFNKEEVFALTVRGDSMIEDHIIDGDIAVIKQQPIASRGQIVAALIDDEATLKHYHPHSDHIELRPANRDYESIIVDSSQSIRIIGLYIGLLRRN